MMNVLLTYFSGTGNTQKVTGLYRAAFENDGHDVTVHSLSYKNSEPAPDARDYELIGIGYPIHAFNAPEIILEYCKRLPPIDIKNGERSKRVFIYKTSGEPVRMSDVSSLKMRKILDKLGYAVQNEYQYVMPYNIIFRHSDAAAYKMWETAKTLVPLDSREILNGVPRLPKSMPFGDLLAWALRVEHPGARFAGRFFGVDENRCIKCGLCVRACPTNNIRTNENQKIVFGGKCMMCMRCAFNCPVNAVDLGMFESWKVNGKYSFEPPVADTVAVDKHDNYCRAAYERYYTDAAARIQNKPE